MKSLVSVLSLSIIVTHLAFAGAQEDLFTATAQCNLEGVKKALAAGADINGLNSYNQNALASAFFCADITKYLLDNGCDPNGGTYPAIIQAANNYAVESLRILLEAGADANKIGVMDGGAHLLVLANKEKEKGKDANQASIKAWEGMAAAAPRTEVNALVLTVQQTNCVPCLELLVKHGADLKGAETNGSLLHRLANFSMTQEERKAGFALGKANMETFGMKVPDWYADLPNDKNGTTAQMAEILIKGGLDVNEKQADGLSAFAVALRLHKLELAKVMMKNGADAVSATNILLGKREMTTYPLNMAAEFADAELLSLMLAQSPDLNTTVETASLGVATDPAYKGNVTFGGDGYTPLIIAIMSGKVDLANLLLDKGASIKIGSSGIAVLKTKISFLHCLTEIKNKTPIYWAVELDDLALVERIGTAMEWKFNPDFTIKQYGGSKGVGAIVWSCAKFKKKQSPSIYATTVGNMKAAGLLMGKGL